MRILLVLLSLVPVAQAQFKVLDAKTTSSLRGIDAVSPQVAWASGSAGTVLLTTNGGTTWKRCVMPKGTEKLDFRGVQGLDEKTAVVMASGKGPLSKVMKTSDGCATWKTVFEDPNEDGFFDALRKVTGRQLYLMGDPVGGKFAMFTSRDAGDTWFIADDPGLDAVKGDGGFAASNSALASTGPFVMFGTGATTAAAPKVYALRQQCTKAAGAEMTCTTGWSTVQVPMNTRSASSGIFSLALDAQLNSVAGTTRSALSLHGVAVGGDYAKPELAADTAAWTADGEHWTAAVAPPGGYRSAVAYDKAQQRWIAVGPTGTDVSRDGGKTWAPLKPSADDTLEADKGWNAISLPFVVGAKGKVGILR